MKKQIVYCSECKYFQAPVEREYRSDIREACLHPSNKTRVDRYDGPIFVPAWKPDKKNEKCDCVLWVRKLSQEEIKQEQKKKSGWLSIFKSEKLDGALSFEEK